MQSAADIAKGALEQVCSGQKLGRMQSFYSECFVDHVNGEVHRGFAGIESSVSLYRRLLAGLRIDVLEQLTEGERVACRFVVIGSCWGKSVKIDGITISRLKDGRIIEDWSVTDSLSLFRQLGFWRCVFVATKRLFLR